MNRVGYLVGTAHEDFLLVMDSGPGVERFGYIRLPGLAKRFAQYDEALDVVRRIDKPGVVVCALYDRGDQWVVVWPDESGMGDEVTPPMLLKAVFCAFCGWTGTPDELRRNVTGAPCCPECYSVSGWLKPRKTGELPSVTSAPRGGRVGPLWEGGARWFRRARDRRAQRGRVGSGHAR